MNTVTEMKVKGIRADSDITRKEHVQERKLEVKIIVVPGDIDSSFKRAFDGHIYESFAREIANTISRKFAGMEFTKEQLCLKWMEVCGEESMKLLGNRSEEIIRLSQDAFAMFVHRKSKKRIESVEILKKTGRR